MKLKDIKPNPNNPRLIRDEKFNRLVESIKVFPKMMELRSLVVDDEMTILGGNMRYKALEKLGYKDIPESWVKKASDLTEEEKKRFVITDNAGFGEWDWDVLANEWEADLLKECGLDLPVMESEEETTEESKFYTITFKFNSDEYGFVTDKLDKTNSDKQLALLEIMGYEK